MNETIVPDGNFDVLLDVALEVSAEIGSSKLPISAILNLGVGSLVHFPQPIEQPVALLVNGRPIARGEIVAVEERFALRITEVLSVPRSER